MRNLDLNLETVSAPWVAPEIQVGVAAGRSGRHQRFANIGHRDAELPCAIAVHLDLDGRIIQRLGVLQIAQRCHLRQLDAELPGERPGIREARSLHGDLDWRWRAETHHLADNVRRLERDRSFGQRLREFSAQLFL